MSIQDATLDTDIFNTIRSLLTSTVIYTTNGTTSATTQAEINAVYNDKNVAKPQIVIYPAEYSFNKFKFNSKATKMITVMIDCYAGKTDELDQLSQQITNVLEDNVPSGIDLVGLSLSYMLDTNNNSKVHGKSITVTYDKS